MSNRESRTRTVSVESALSRVEPGQSDGPRVLVGAVVTGGSSFPAYYGVQPVLVGGQESEGVAPVNSASGQVVQVAFYDRAPVSGQTCIAVWIETGARWVAFTHGARAGNDSGIYGSIPSCFCTKIPGTLRMTSADPACNYRMFQSCTIQWQPTPSMFSSLNIGPNAFLSTESFPDPIAGGAIFYYYLICHLNQFSLTRLYPVSPYGSPFRDAILYIWALGGYGNTCDPFHLDNGTAFPGSDISCSVTIDA